MAQLPNPHPLLEQGPQLQRRLVVRNRATPLKNEGVVQQTHAHQHRKDHQQEQAVHHHSAPQQTKTLGCVCVKWIFY
jgi:hypothetical protein